MVYMNLEDHLLQNTMRLYIIRLLIVVFMLGNPAE